MPITEIRILPPIAIARLGAAATPLAAYSLALPDDKPLDFRRIVPQPTPEIDDKTGAIISTKVPDNIHFKEGNLIRPVAPFLEVWAVTAPDTLEPLTLDLLKQEGLDLGAVSWSIEVANHKAFRRTNDQGDKITAKIDSITDHKSHPLLGTACNFLPGKTLPFGSVRFIKPTAEFPGIRLRFTPAGGYVYGARSKRPTAEEKSPEGTTFTYEDDPVLTPERIIYDESKPWCGYYEPDSQSIEAAALTNPGQIYAGYANQAGNQVSWGYLDDACDGLISVELVRKGQKLKASAHVSSGPPTFVPDALPIRTTADEFAQIIHGPVINPDEEVPIEEAMEIVRRSLDTIRQLNTAVMNGNPINGRLDMASTMVRQDSADFGRMFAPIAAVSMVDQSAVRTLHERVFTALSSGSAPWFAHVLRLPEEIGDMTDQGRRKMPAMMRGADGRMLCLTRRQIQQVIRAASGALFQPATQPPLA